MPDFIERQPGLKWSAEMQNASRILCRQAKDFPCPACGRQDLATNTGSNSYVLRAKCTCGQLILWQRVRRGR